MKLNTLTAAILAASAAMTLAFGTSAVAQTPGAPVAAASGTATPHFDKRQERQHKRMAQGAASGELTPAEAAHLSKREARIEAHKQAAKADGTVTHAERKHLMHQQNHASKAIHKQKHDAQTAPASAASAPK